MRDFQFDDDSNGINHIEQLVRGLQEHMLRFGYQYVEMPLIDTANLFLTKAGDQIINRLFTFERHGQQLALRPEFTAAVAHHYVMSMPEDRPIVRWQLNGPVFEDDPADYTLDYQRLSVGAEFIGLDGPLAESEIIGMAVSGAIVLGLTDWQLDIGHVGLTRHLLSGFGLGSSIEHVLLYHYRQHRDHRLDKTAILNEIDRLLPEDKTAPVSTTISQHDLVAIKQRNTQHMLDLVLDTTRRGAVMGGRSRDDIVQRLLRKQSQTVTHDQVAAALDFLEYWEQIDTVPTAAFAAIKSFLRPNDNKAVDMLKDWQQTVDLLGLYGIPPERVRIRPYLARTWDYYTGVVFELRSNTVVLAGGGRYDELIRLLGGGSDIPAVGFAYYLDRLATHLPEADLPTQHSFTLMVSDNDIQAGIRWAQRLRQHGVSLALVPTETKSNDDTALFVDSDDQLHVRQTTYAPDEIEEAVADIMTKR